MYLPHAQGSGFPFVEFDISQSPSAGAPVLCAWPLSGQYGVGSRYLYYGLVSVSIFFLKTDWMRGAATAAALIYAAVAALHAILLAVFSHKDAVDMDIFGAFQILSIGVLSAPITVRYSRVYFQADGRNIIFLWTMLVIAGLLSLVACFARATERACVDAHGVNITIDQFRAGMNSSDTGLCALQCDSAYSPIRQDPQNPAQYILVPHKGMTLDTATLLCAACCIPAFLSLIAMWQKVVKANWLLLYGHKSDDTPIQDDATPPPPTPPKAGPSKEERLSEKKMDVIIKRGLSLVERIVYCVCILTVVVLGEENFWSPETRLGVEPMSSVGQWAPIIGAVFAALGSAYTSWLSPRLPRDAQADILPGEVGPINLTDSPQNMHETLHPDGPPHVVLTRDRARRRSSSRIQEEMQHHRQQFARGLNRVVAWTTPGSDRYLDDITRTAGHDKFRSYPLIPGEELRSDHWEEDVMRYELSRTGRSRSAQSLVTVGTTSSQGIQQDSRRPVMIQNASASGRDSGLLMLPTWTPQPVSRARPSLIFSGADSSESAVEDDDAIVMVPRRSSVASSPADSPPVIVVTPDEST